MITAETPWDAIISPDVLGNIGAGALLALFVIAILRGALVTRTQYNDLKDQRDRWESAYWKEKEASSLQDRQNDELMETARTMRHFMDAFPRPVVLEREEIKK
jgi:hypothetical protein